MTKRPKSPVPVARSLGLPSTAPVSICMRTRPSCGWMVTVDFGLFMQKNLISHEICHKTHKNIKITNIYLT